jgi:uncharacterized protein YutE (UPF0331/DUF86 family)
MMVTSIANTERDRALQLAQEYRDKGYEVLLEPPLENLPDFLQKYRPDIIASRGGESVVIEVKSRSALNSTSHQYLRDLAQLIEQQPGWRFELVVTNPEDTAYSRQAEESFQQNEIESRLQVARQLATQHVESAFLYSWSLVEATLRLVIQNEGLNSQRFSPIYLVKELVIAGIISKSEYQLLMNAISLRNAIVHGFKTTQQITQNSVSELIEITEQLLKTLHSEVAA